MRRPRSRRIPRTKSSCAHTEPLEPRVFLSASLLKDLNLTPATDAVAQAAGYDGTFYFVAADSAHGFELWKSDGTAAGTAMVKDINPGGGSSYASGLTVVDGTLFFAATDGVHGTELWKSDGTAAGTVMAKDINPGPNPSSPDSLVAYGGKLYFAATDPSAGRELWTSDGTAAGTRLALDINPGPADSNPDGLTVAGPKLYFTAIQRASNGSFDYLWGSNGTQAGTVKLDQDVFEFAPVGDLLFYQNVSRGLSVTDGTTAGTRQVLPAYDVSHIAGVNGVALFSANDGVHGTELWRSDGTAAGTFMVKDIEPGSASGYGNYQPEARAVANGRLFFVATDGTTAALWQSDGTAAGTTVVTDTYGSTFYWPQMIAAAGGSAYFSDGSALYRTDGTPNGATLVADVGSGTPTAVTDAGTKVYFMGTGGAGTLWAGDGTAAGTVLVGTVRLPSDDELYDFGGHFTAVGGTTYFVAEDGILGPELWKTDGTAAGTMMVKDIYPGYLGSYASDLTNLNGTLLLVARTGASGFELWRSNGTAAGTVLVKDIYAGTTSSAPDGLTVVGNVAYFTATDAGGGRELWKTDGTAAGTVRVKDINPGLAGSDPQNLTAVGGTLYFTANDGAAGRELWKSDGTAAGTVLVKDINPGAGGITLVSGGGTCSLGGAKLVFVANDGTHGLEAWVSDGTAAGTFMLADVNPGSGGAFGPYDADLFEYAGRVYYGATNGNGRYNLWSTDGTAAGTGLFFTTNESTIQNFVVLNGRMIFTVFSSGGMGTWRTDGTVDGTELLTGGLDAPLWLSTGSAVFGGRVYFFAADPQHGWELFSTDGTAEGTGIAVDVRPGPEDSLIQGYDNVILANGEHLFFPGDDGLSGRGVWVLSAPAAAIAPASVAEGGTVSLNGVPAGTVTDPLDPVTYLWDLDSDGIFGETGADATRGDEVGPTPVFSATGLDGPSAVPVALRAIDSAGTTTTQGSITITNAAPAVTVDPIPPGAVEGDTLHFTGSASDPSPADIAAGLTLRWTVTRNGVTLATATTAAAGFDFQAPDDGDYVVSLAATDRNGAATTASATFHVANAAPTATLANAIDAVAGVPVLVQLTGAADPSSADLAAGLQYGFDLDGDGVFEIASPTPSATRTFMTGGTYTVRARVRDKDGGEGVYTTTVNVSLPAPPAASLTSGGPVDEGTAGSVSFGPASGAGSFTYSYDFDNDGTFEVAGTTSAAATVPAEYLADGPFVRVVRGRVTDAFGQFADYTATIAVTNVEPTLAIPAAAGGSVVLGTGFALSLSAVDPGQDAVIHWHINWGDGQTSDSALPSGLFNHTYESAGIFPVTATATDEDGSYAATTNVTVTATPPTASFSAGSLTAGGSAYRFTVNYADDLGIDAATLGDGDLEITGPAGTSLARLVSYAPASDGRGGVATYDVASPLGTWSWQDRGTYAVSVRAGEVRDLQGIDLPAGEIGSFAINLSAPSAPDLVQQFVGPTPKSLAPGGTYSVSVKVTNHGSKSMPTAPVTTRLYLSADGTVDVSDVLLATSKQRFGLPVNGSRQITFSFASPVITTGGGFKLLAVVDAAGKVAERDERNNAATSGRVSVKPAKVDLATSFASAPKSGYAPGKPVPLSLKFTNAGNAPAKGRAGLRVYFSTNPVLDDSDTLLLTRNVRLNLATKASSVFNVKVKLPASAAGPKGYLLAILDASGIGDRKHANDSARTGPFALPAK